MARYNSVNSTGSVAGGNSITTPYSGLLTTLTGSGTVTVPNPVYYTGQIQTFYNSTLSAITLSTPSGSFIAPGFTTASSLSLPAGSIITLTSDGTNYIAQSWLGGIGSHTSLSASGGTVTLNGSTTGSIDNVVIGGTTAAAGTFNGLTNTLGTTSLAGGSASGVFTFSSSQGSSAYNNGAVVISNGGLGVAGNVYVNGISVVGTYGTPTTGAGFRTNTTDIYGQAAATDKIRLSITGDSWFNGGNLGLGVTPPTIYPNRRALVIGGPAVASVYHYAGIGESAYNWYLDGSAVARYATTNYAGTFEFNNSATGGFAWKLAPSGTAGNAISFTQAMTLDASGNLMLGQTSPVYSGKLTVNGGPSNPGVNANGFALATSGPYGGGLLLVDGTNNWGLYDVVGTLNWAFGTSGGALSNKMSITSAGALTVASTIGSGGTITTGNGYVIDQNSQPITLRYIDIAGTYAGTWTNINGYIGGTADPAYGYVLLCKAYSSGGAVNYSGFTGFVYRRRGNTGAFLQNYACYVSVASAYLGNTVGGANLGQPSWYIVSVTYGGQLYLAVRTDNTSAATIDVAGAYTANFTPTVVADNTISGETILKTLS
jgi:hypothetical protein